MDDHRERVHEFETTLGYAFEHIELLYQALTHRSYLNENPDPEKEDNERLEFLGDAVLDLCITDILMRNFPDYSEGHLSKMRAAIVNEQHLAEVARHARIGEFIMLGRGEEMSGGRAKNSILSNSLEAVVGAIYMDRGFDPALDYIRRTFEPFMDRWVRHPVYKDYKTYLQEFSQNRYKTMPKYTLVHEHGPDHEKIFHIRLTISDVLTAIGVGKSKKEAEQRAAKMAFEELRESGLIPEKAESREPEGQ
ncbi:MAG TPA: ribonuclease III [Syntrophales bacterium]|nr:ribonuclease III [Syntrophales bacterium]